MMSSLGTTSLRYPNRFRSQGLLGKHQNLKSRFPWTRAVGDVIKSLGEEHGPVPRHGGSVKGLDNEAYGVHMNGAGGLWPTLSITNAIGRNVLFCYDLKLPESFTPKNQDGELESSNVKAPQALCIHLTRELAIQNMEVLQKMGKYTGINAECVVPTERTSSTSIQSRAPVSAQIVIGTHDKRYVKGFVDSCYESCFKNDHIN
ncbi:unnamed protein product [Prunus armeniaca]